MNAYVAGYTTSVDFPTQSAYQPNKSGDTDAFVAKFNAAGNALVYSTYLGGSGDGEAKGYGIAVDALESASVVGQTRETDFPTKNPYQSNLRGEADAFVTKFQGRAAAPAAAPALGAGALLALAGLLGAAGWAILRRRA